MKAVLDACVLFPTVLREILLGVAGKGIYEPLWSDRILREWVRATAKLGPEAAMEAEAQATLARLAFPSAMQREQPNIEARLYLPDPNDVHVLAVAIASHADAIVTFNAVDFPRHVLAGEGLQTMLDIRLYRARPGEAQKGKRAALAFWNQLGDWLSAPPPR